MSSELAYSVDCVVFRPSGFILWGVDGLVVCSSREKRRKTIKRAVLGSIRTVVLQ